MLPGHLCKPAVAAFPDGGVNAGASQQALREGEDEVFRWCLWL